MGSLVPLLSWSFVVFFKDHEIFTSKISVVIRYFSLVEQSNFFLPFPSHQPIGFRRVMASPYPLRVEWRCMMHVSSMVWKFLDLLSVFSSPMTFCKATSLAVLFFRTKFFMISSIQVNLSMMTLEFYYWIIQSILFNHSWDALRPRLACKRWKPWSALRLVTARDASSMVNGPHTWNYRTFITSGGNWEAPEIISSCA